MRRILLAALLAMIADAAEAQTIHADKKGAELRKRLREDYTPNSLLNYNAARMAMFGIVENNGDNEVELAYTSELFPISPTHPIPSANGPDGVNTEHTWPQSMFHHVEGPGMKTDIHHLFPVRARVNSDRGNKPFAEIPDDQTKRWWNGPNPQSARPGAGEIDKFSEVAGQVFEPEEDHKGNVARAMVYFFTIYEEDPNVVKSFLTDQAPTLKAWHVKDPVDAREMDRGRRIELIQGNVNPYAFDETLLGRALDDIVPAGELAGLTPTPIGPSPVMGGATTDPVLGVSIIALLPNPEGVDQDNESVTLANSTDTGVDLTGWKLVDKQGREFALSGAIPANQTHSIRLINSAMSLGNNGGMASLFDADGTRRQTVSYTKEQARSGSFVMFGS